jgi:hypothetical protein
MLQHGDGKPLSPGHTFTPRSFTAGAEGQGMAIVGPTTAGGVANHITSGAGPAPPGPPQGKVMVVSDNGLSDDELDLFEDVVEGPSDGGFGG